MKKFCYLAIGVMACLATSCEQNAPATSNRVKTGVTKNLTTNSVTLHGSVNVDLLAYESVEYGMMISTDKTEMNERKGEQIAVQYLIGTELILELNGLQPATEYYYSTWLLLNNQQYEYGSIESFVTPNPIEGIGEFSVSANQTVTFSPGNLQYLPSEKTWRFAESQHQYIGKNNILADSLYNDYVDMFAWGTGANPICDSSIIDFVDWGTNVIELEGRGIWRTLTNDEWDYLISQRSDADSLIAIAQINGINGLILLPDNWKRQQGTDLTIGFSKEWGKECYANQQILTNKEWEKLEATGAVFLPTTGYISSGYLLDEQYFGQYWTSTDSENKNAAAFVFYSGGCETRDQSKASKRCVRLVKNCK